MLNQFLDNNQIHDIVPLFVLLRPHLEEVIPLLAELLPLERFVPQAVPLRAVSIVMARGAQRVAVFRVEARVLMAPAPIVGVVTAHSVRRIVRVKSSTTALTLPRIALPNEIGEQNVTFSSFYSSP